MRRIRTGLLLAALGSLFLSLTAGAQVAPSLTGESGLFELTNADTLPSGRFSLGLYYSVWDRTAAPSLVTPEGVDDPLRYGTSKLGLTVGYGATNNLELTLGIGQRFFEADQRFWSGVIGGHEVSGRVRHNETDKIRLGAKLLLNSKTQDPPVKLVLFAGYSIPTQSKSSRGALSTYRADTDFGLSVNYKIFTVQASYFLAGDLGDQFDVANTFTWGFGVGIPIIPNVLKGIAEINRVHYDGGDSKPDDFTDVTAGARFAIGKTGVVASGALRVAVDRWVKYQNSPSNIGGLVQIAYSPQPDIVIAPHVPGGVTTPEPAPTAATTGETPTPTPTTQTTTTVEPAPVPRPETSTTDEILFDAAKSRLTNIAKAILDGVALRLKNNLSATCTVAAYTDPKEKGGDHMALAKARAEAAKDYLVKRHGIDAARIKTEVKGDAEAGADGTRNRRAVVTVTFP
ncbi:MAG TPA: OmpA family protein [Thermoanaerobaculia bacterium]|jgi:outer membrane protein OmpA-like peptidoglycan-associated protein|nr:OmpA family protein [Thermoanaerobaculia bacterium]